MPHGTGLADLKPFAWMAFVAFLVGFFSYFAFGDSGRAVAQEQAPYVAASAPASNAWNLPKHI